MDAAIVVDGNGDEVIETLLAAGWTYDGNSEVVAGKRVRSLVPPPGVLESALANSAAGNVTDLGDFTQYADDETNDETEETQ